MSTTSPNNFTKDTNVILKCLLTDLYGTWLMIDSVLEMFQWSNLSFISKEDNTKAFKGFRHDASTHKKRRKTVNYYSFGCQCKTKPSPLHAKITDVEVHYRKLLLWIGILL